MRPSIKFAVYKLVTSRYRTKRGYAVTKKLEPVKKLGGWDWFSEEFSALGGNALDNIINYHEVPDGLYTIETTKPYNGEFGDVELKLVSYDPNEDRLRPKTTDAFSLLKGISKQP